MSKSINMVNRYCARLPSDSFTQLTPRWQLTALSDGMGYRCTIKLPINSPFKDRIVGESMPTKKLAKMAAAMKTVEALHKSGDLDSSMNPLGKTDCWRGGKSDSVILQEEREISGEFLDLAHIGSTKRRQYYYKKVSDKLSNCCPVPGQPGYLYHIDLRLTAPLPDQQNTRGRPCYHPEKDPRGFAILTIKPLEQIPTFPLFTRSGEESVELSVFPGPGLVHTTEQLDRLKQFHHVLFQAVLRLEKEAAMKFDFDRAYSQALIVPVNMDDKGIDWAIIDHVLANFCPDENVCKVPPRMDNRGLFEFRQEDYINTVVMPSYRNYDQPQHYYVAEIMEELGPRSSFPSELYTNFEDYYSKKYHARVTNSRQPLLDVDFTAIRLNLLVPRYLGHKGQALPTTSDERKRVRRDNINQKQLLLPELCFRHPFPASVWRKAVCIPAVLYRLNSLLLAEELRYLIASSTHIGPADLPPDFQFPGLELSFPETGSNGDNNGSNNGAAGLLVVMANNSVGSGGDGGQSSFVRCYVDSVALSETKLLPSNPVNEEAEGDEGCGELRIVGIDDVDHDEGRGAYNEDEARTSGVQDRTAIEEDEDDAESVDSFEGNVPAGGEDDETYRFFTSTETGESTNDSSLIYQPSPTLLLQTVTMSCSNDFFNLERMETIGDSFLKFAVTVHHFILYSNAHEGNLSFLRSKQVCNLNLYRLSKQKGLGELMVGNKFEPHDNWIPPGYAARYDPRFTSDDDPMDLKDEIQNAFQYTNRQTCWPTDQPRASYGRRGDKRMSYCLRIQQSLTDKSLADCVEALIGCYLTSRGHVVALRVMRWLGIDCMPQTAPLDEDSAKEDGKQQNGDSYYNKNPESLASVWRVPELLKPVEAVNMQLWHGFDELEGIIKYKFRNRNYLIQAFTHASYHYNETTDCYQRLEFLGDAVLDYVITRFLYEDCKKHSPGVLTDLRSALVNNNIFAALAVKWDLHRFFKCCSPELLSVIDRFVRYQKDLNKDDLDFITNEDLDSRDHEDGPTTLEMPSIMSGESATVAGETSTDGVKGAGAMMGMGGEGVGVCGSGLRRTEAIEIPKALGDIFESLAGAVFLDAGLSLDVVWRVFYRLMQERIERYTACIPKSPVRELLELEAETAKFERPLRTGDGRIRVCVHVVGKGRFVGLGRNYRIAKSVAAKRALRVIKRLLAANAAAELNRSAANEAGDGGSPTED